MSAHPMAMGEFADGKQRITALLDELKELTEREVLACGNTLSKLVDTARELIAESERDAVAMVARSEEVTSEFVGAMGGLDGLVEVLLVALLLGLVQLGLEQPLVVFRVQENSVPVRRL